MMNDNKIILKLKEEPLLFDFGDILLKMIDIENINQNIAENLQFCTIPAWPASYEYKIEILSRQKRIHENLTNRAAIKILQNQFLTQSRTYLSTGSGDFFYQLYQNPYFSTDPSNIKICLSQSIDEYSDCKTGSRFDIKPLFIYYVDTNCKKNSYLIFGQ